MRHLVNWRGKIDIIYSITQVKPAGIPRRVLRITVTKTPVKKKVMRTSEKYS